MGILAITGGSRLFGEVCISGAKNAVLPMLTATVAQSGEYQLENCPRLRDVDSTLSILRSLGCSVQQRFDTIYVDSRGLNSAEIPCVLMRRLRSSVLFLGALLARCGEATICMPGGCCLGERPIDLHLSALEQMGVQIRITGEQIRCSAAGLHGARIQLPFVSVGVTENIMLAAMGCDGPVTVCGAAREPEITALGQMLSRMGAQVSGAGSTVLELCAGPQSRSVQCRVLPDRIEAATYLSALASCGGEVYLKNAESSAMCAVCRVLRQAGVQIFSKTEGILARCGSLYAVPPIRTSPYPGFPTDAQAVVMAAMLRADGETRFEETIFEDRFRHVPALQALGAEIRVEGRCAAVYGGRPLHGAQMTATDLRGGAAMVVAALHAQGRSLLRQTEHIARGYECLPEKLTALGAQVSRASDENEADISCG